MIITTRLRLITIAATALFVSTIEARAEERLHINGGDVTVVCPLTVGGSFEAKTKALSGEVGPAPQQAGGLGGALLVKLDTLETGIGLRDHHLRDNYLEVGKGAGYDVATIENIQLEKSDGKAAFQGTLVLHGQKRQVNGRSTIHRRGDGTIHVDAEFSLRLELYLGPAHIFPKRIGMRLTRVITFRSPTIRVRT